MAEAQVGVLVTAKNNATPVLDRVKRSLNELDKTAKTTAGGVKGLTGDMGGMVMALGGLGVGVAGIVALGSAIGDLVQRGAQVKALESSFSSMAAGVGESSAQMLAGLRTASQGMIADRDLILSANRAMMLGVAQSTEEMSSLLQVAAVRGQALGLSVSQAFSDIVTGIGRMSPLILDNLGIVTGGEKVFDDYARSIGKTTTALSDMERKQALVNAVMASTDTSVGIAISGVAKLESAWSNLGDALAKSLASSGLDQAIGSIAEGLNAQITAAETAEFKAIQDAAGNTRDKIAALTQEVATYKEMLAQNRAAAFVADERQITDQIAATEMQILLLTAQLPYLETAANKAAAALGKLQGPKTNMAGLAFDLSWGKGAFTPVGYPAAVQAEVDKAKGIWVSGVKGMYAEGRIQSERELLAWMDSIDPIIQRVYQDRIAQGLSPEQIARVGFGDTVQAELANAGTLGIPKAQTIGQQWAESLRTGIESRLQGKAIDIAFSTEPSLNRAAEGAEWLDSVMRTVNQSTSFWAGEVDAGRMSLTEATIAAEMLATQISQSGDEIASNNNAFLIEAQLAYNVGVSLAAGMAGAESIVDRILNKFGQAVSAGAGFVGKTILNFPGKQILSTVEEGAYQYYKKTGDAEAAQAKLVADTNAARTQGIQIMTEANGNQTIIDWKLREYNEGLAASNALLTQHVGGGGGGGGLSAVSQAWDNIRGKVQSVLSQAMGADIGGLDPKNFLPREDAINENARRLAAIMRDGIGNQEWLPEFKAETGGLFDELIASGDVRGAAARILQEFQAGMRPELLDREMVKENVRRMILGEQSMAELADQIARELAAETGMSMARVQSMVGAQMGTSPGAGMQQAMSEGADGGTQAESFVSGWVATMNKLYARIYETGASSGAQWGAGFMATVEGGVPGALIGLLVGLVTPGVMAQIAAQQSTAGAR